MSSSSLANYIEMTTIKILNALEPNGRKKVNLLDCGHNTADTYGWTLRPHAPGPGPGACSWSHELTRIAAPDWDSWSLHTLLDWLGLLYPTAPNGAEGPCWPDPGWNRLKALLTQRLQLA
jgi:hypothetical protein